MIAKPIAVIPDSIMGPEDFAQARPMIEAAGYVMLRVRAHMINEKVYVASSGAVAAPDVKPSWICEFCYARAYVSKLPGSWDFVCQSAVCGDCRSRVAADGGYAVVKGGAYAEVPDPRPWSA